MYKPATDLPLDSISGSNGGRRWTVHSTLMHLGICLTLRAKAVLSNCRSMNSQHSRVLILFDYSRQCDKSNCWYQNFMDMAYRIFENKLNTVWLYGSYKKLFDNKLNKASVYNQEQLVEIQKCLFPKK